MWALVQKLFLTILSLLAGGINFSSLFWQRAVFLPNFDVILTWNAPLLDIVVILSDLNWTSKGRPANCMPQFSLFTHSLLRARTKLL